MFRTRLFFICVAIALIGVLSLALLKSAAWQLAAAQKLQRSGHYESALQIYRSVLARSSKHDSISQTYLSIGECLWSLGRSSDAFLAFQESADADVRNLRAHLRLGNIYMMGGAASRAAEQARTALQLSPNDVDALVLLGNAASTLGDDEIALAAYERVLAADPRRTSVAISLADIYNRKDRVADARLVLRKAAEMQPHKADPWLALGRLEEQEGNTDAADEAYRTAVQKEDTPESNLRLAQFLERDAKLGEAERILHHVDLLRPAFPVTLADFQIDSGNPADAVQHYADAIRSQKLKRGVSQAESRRAEIVARLIEADLASGFRAEAPAGSIARGRLNLQQYEAELDPGTISVLRAEIALAENDVAGALAHAESAINLAPGSAAARYVRGVALYRGGDRTNARSSWLDALDLDADNVPTRVALAQDALATGDYLGAEHYIVSVVRDEPANLRALDIFGRALRSQRRLASAAVVARRAVIVDSDSAAPHVLLADILFDQRQYAAALLEYERAVVLEPRSEQALDGLTRIYRLGVISRPMLRRIEVVAELPPASAALMEIAGRLYFERGWTDDARRCFERAIQMDPQRTTAAAALARSFLFDGRIGAATASAKQMGGVAAAIMAGVTAEERGDQKGAIMAYESAYRQGDDSGVAANNLAWIYAQQNTNLERALLVANKAVSLRPKDPAVLDTLGFVHLRRREYSRAISTLERARAMLVRNGTTADTNTIDSIRRHLTQGYLHAGESQAAERLERDLELRGALSLPSRTAANHLSSPGFTRPRAQY